MGTRDNEKYYWLRLYDDLFTSKRIKKLRKLGADFFIIYLKMQLLSLQHNGVIQYTGLEDTFAEELAIDIDEDSDKIQITMAYLQSCGLLEASDSEIFLPYVEKCTGSETRAAERKREYRSKLTEKGDNVPLLSHDCPLEKEKKKEKKKESDKEKDNKQMVYFPNDELLNEAFSEFVKMRKQIKAPMTDRAITLAINQLEKMASDNDEKIEIINQSIINSWKGLFPLKKQEQPKQSVVDEWLNA